MWGEFRRSWRDFGRYWKLWLLFSIFWYIPWIVANWVLPLYGIPEEISLIVMVGGISLAFLVTLGGFYGGWGYPSLKCPMCGELLKERREGNVIVFHCSTHGDVRGIILAEEG